MYFIISRFSKK